MSSETNMGKQAKNVTIGEGAIISSNSLVLKDVEPWSINIGSPCRQIGARPRLVVLDI